MSSELLSSVRASDASAIALVATACVAILVRLVCQRCRPQPLPLKFTAAVVISLMSLAVWHFNAQANVIILTSYSVEPMVDECSLEGHHLWQERLRREWESAHDSMIMVYRGFEAELSYDSSGHSEVTAADSVWYWVAGAVGAWALLVMAAIPWRQRLRPSTLALISCALLVASVSAWIAWAGAEAYFHLSFVWKL